MIHSFNDFIKEIYSNYNTFNPFEIAEQSDIELRYEPFLGSPFGQYVFMFNKKTIIIKDSLRSSNERFFVMAHELYHALMHSELSGYYVQNTLSRSKLETEANKFATVLLIHFYIEEHGVKPYSYDELFNLYGVPKPLLETYII